jgi:hypothetical protein
MKKIFESMKPYALAVLPVAAIIICAWQNPKQNQRDIQKTFTNQKDTVPEAFNKEDNDEFNMGDLDKAMKELDISMDKLDEQLKYLDININKEVEESLAKIDFDKIGKEVEQSVKAINWREIQKEIDNSMEQAQEEIKKIDFNKINDGMKELQEKFQSKESKEQFNSEKLHKEVDDAMNKAKEGIGKAKEELQELKSFTEELAKDGLIDKKKGYTIHWKHGNLYINGKEQPKSVSDKYRKYEKKDGYEINMNERDSEKF